MSILARLGEAKNKLLFAQRVKQLRRAPPARVGAGTATVLSMVQHRDVDAYLLALKSFVHRVDVAQVVVVADPTLTDDDRALLQEHVPGIRLRDAGTLRNPRAPVGGTWERLLAIADEVRDSFVIQLDADTVTAGRVDEVTQSIAAGTAFLLAGERGVQILTCEEVAADGKAALAKSAHVQVLAESRVGALNSGRWRYARACSGFTGFPRGSFDLARVLEICDTVGAALGPRWSEWGTEQFASNLIAASCPGARVLPHPKYCNANHATPETAFFHFIGYTRFTSTAYSDWSVRIAAELDRARGALH